VITRDHFEGCLLGLALGDAVGAPAEGGFLERLVWRFIGTTSRDEMRWTDDTQMSLDVAESLLSHGRVEPDDLARRFAAGYRWTRGYGPGTAKLLKRVASGTTWEKANRSVYPEGSFGNGGAMRSPVIGLFFAGRQQELVEAARLAARVTHAHPIGEEGAVLIATATARAALGQHGLSVVEAAAANCTLEAFQKRLAFARDWLTATKSPPTALEVRRRLGNGISAHESCVTALYCALRFIDAPLLELLSFVASIRGDVDTIGAMAGAVWGAANGSGRLPGQLLSRLEQKERLTSVAAQLYAKSEQRDV